MIVIKLHSSRRREQEQEQAQQACVVSYDTTKRERLDSKETCEGDDDTATVTTAYDNSKIRTKDLQVMKARIEFASQQSNKIALLGLENEIKKLKAKKLKEAKDEQAEAADKEVASDTNIKNQVKEKASGSSLQVHTATTKSNRKQSMRRKLKLYLLVKNSRDRALWFKKSKME